MDYRFEEGFTLIELMIVIVIIGILTYIAIASYTYYAFKGQRGDGLNAILAVALAEERYRAYNTTYGTLAQAYNSVTTSPQGYYTLSVSSVTATSYTISATAVGNQANDKEGSTSCSPLQYTMSAGTITKTPTVCWPS